MSSSLNVLSSLLSVLSPLVTVLSSSLDVLSYLLTVLSSLLTVVSSLLTVLSLAFTRLYLHPASSVFLQLRGPGGRHPPGPVEVSRATLHQAQALRHVQVNTPRAISARSLVVLLLDL